ncbi:MAG: hypothetical protein OXF49_03275 [Candidatus Saccharibacteria bacterium]|nr:hypothetical protein [Candidatus Saccharibacteria bacterium]
MQEFTKIKNQTKLKLPKDSAYLFRLGVALYGFNCINSFIIEIVCHLDKKQNKIQLNDKSSGDVLDILRQTLKSIKSQKVFPSIYKTMQKMTDLFEKLNTERTDFIHSYPITSPKGNQILHRRKDSKNKHFEITNEFLDSFISRLHKVSNGLYEIREVVKSDLQ